MLINQLKSFESDFFYKKIVRFFNKHSNCPKFDVKKKRKDKNAFLDKILFLWKHQNILPSQREHRLFFT